MALEDLPEVSMETFEAHSARLRNKDLYIKFINKTYLHLKEHNPALFSIIEGTAKSCDNPKAIRIVAYTVLNMIGDQLEANKLNGHLEGE